MSYMQSVVPNKQFGSCGRYRIINPIKYIGETKVVIYRSSLELEFCKFCDTDPTVIRWISEPDLGIKYMNPFKKRVATYYPDFMVQFKSNKSPSGVLQAVIEIKADGMINLPKHGDISKMSKFVQKNFILNQTKKKAAEKACTEKNMKYIIITEKSEFFKRNT